MLPSHFKELGDKSEFPQQVEKFAHGLVEALVFHFGVSAKVLSGTKMLTFDAPLGLRGSKVHAELTRYKPKGEQQPFYKLRLELNPRKVGLEGCNKLQTLFADSALKGFNFGDFLADAWLTRLDWAVDYAGVRPSELILTTKKEGKRILYMGQDGALETVQLHAFKKPPKPNVKKPKALGKLLAKIYDRNRERAARGKLPPFPGFEVTRLEVVRVRFPKHEGLVDILDTGNPFADIRLSYRDALVRAKSRKRWRTYCAMRQALGHDQAVQVLGTAGFIKPTAKQLFEGHPSNLLPKGVWQEASHGVATSGLAHLLTLAHEGKAAKQPQSN